MTEQVSKQLNTVLLNVEASEKEIRKQIEQGHAGIAKVQAQITQLEEHLGNTLALKMLLIHASVDKKVVSAVESLLGPAANDSAPESAVAGE